MDCGRSKRRRFWKQSRLEWRSISIPNDADAHGMLAFARTPARRSKRHWTTLNLRYRSVRVARLHTKPEDMILNFLWTPGRRGAKAFLLAMQHDPRGMTASDVVRTLAMTYYFERDYDKAAR